jgi:hypothetical protein
MRYFTLLALLLSACGPSGNTIHRYTTISPPISPTVTQTTMFSIRQADGSTTPGLFTVTSKTRVYIPDLTRLVVIQNSTEFWHVSLGIGDEFCDYIHDAGSSVFVWGAGCSMSPFVDLNPGQIITVNINTAVSQSTAATVTLDMEGI